MTPDDLRILIESEDENVRKGNFIRVFPTVNSKKYLKFFETPRYYNILLCEWLSKYRHSHDKGNKMTIRLGKNFYLKYFF